MKRSFLTAATTTFAVTFLMASSAHATSLGANSTVTPAVLSNLTSEVTGAALATTGPTTYYTKDATTGLIETGSYEVRVFKSLTTGYLDFVYDFNEIAGSTTAVNTATMSSFLGYSTDVFIVNSSPLAGTIVSATSSSKNAGDTVKFFFPTSGVPAGDAASEMVIRVNAATYVPGSYTIQNGAVSTLSGYMPSGPATTPEPASFAMIGAGLLALGYFRRKNA